MAGVAAHLLVDDLDRPEIADRDRHHVERVLRLRAGEVVSVTDGRGGQRTCRLAGSGGSLDLTAEGEADRMERPAPEVAVGFALVKHDRPEWIVQKLTECGVDRIVPFVAARSVVRWDEEKRVAHHRRWVEVVREATMQSRRRWLPVVDPICDLDAFDPSEAVRADLDTAASPPAADGRVVLIGPEGGWDDRERRSIPATVSLGPHVLRAETAAVAAAVLCVANRSGLVR